MIYEVYHNDKTHRDRERGDKIYIYIYTTIYICVFYLNSRANKSLICIPVFILILIGIDSFHPVL